MGQIGYNVRNALKANFLGKKMANSTKSLQKRLFIQNRGDGYPPVCSQSPYFKWSGRRDSNSRPTVPKTVALPGCATPRSLSSIT